MTIPPLAEQKHIVEKCDRLMSLCGILEAKLKQREFDEPHPNPSPTRRGA